MKPFLTASVAAAALALCATSASASLLFMGQISWGTMAQLNPASTTGAVTPMIGGQWSPFDNATSPWLNIEDGGSATFDATDIFTFVWGSPNPGDSLVTTSDGQSYTTADLIAAAALDGVTVVNQPYTPGYLVEVTGDFTSVTLTMSGGDGGNFEIGAVPEASTWAMLGLGFAGLAFAGYRSRRAAISIA